MTSFEHKEIIKAIELIDELPPTQERFAEWLKARQHLKFLEENSRAQEIAIFASGPYLYLHSVLVPNSLLSTHNTTDLLAWSAMPSYAASYVYGGGREDVWIERDSGVSGPDILKNGKSLVFSRDFEGRRMGEHGWEISQEYLHLAGLHELPERSSFCMLDENGDYKECISITSKKNPQNKTTLISFDRDALEMYMAASDSSLVRLFDVTLVKPGDFSQWSQTKEDVNITDESLFYRQKVDAGSASYTRGVQIVRCSQPKQSIFDVYKNPNVRNRNDYVEFIALDWRNKTIGKISTDPAKTTNYFDAKRNKLPFELSPAFFRSDVLLKYKADKDKYTIRSREISCRGAWYLKGYDINEAGQVHAYICDLRRLPHSEQLHWQSYNESPKGAISKRAYDSDFAGKWSNHPDPLGDIKRVLDEWDSRNVNWWSLKDASLMDRVTLPITNSTDEWSDSFLELSKLVIEGFSKKAISQKLKSLNILFDATEGPFALLEKLLRHSHALESDEKLGFLREAQQIRTKTKGHADAAGRVELSAKAIRDFGTYKVHFEHVCEGLLEELQKIEIVWNKSDDSVIE